jgi:hypothetical protein
MTITPSDLTIALEQFDRGSHAPVGCDIAVSHTSRNHPGDKHEEEEVEDLRSQGAGHQAILPQGLRLVKPREKLVNQT